MSWALKRKLLYIGGLLLFIVAIIAPIIYANYPKASCFDNIQNQGELDIDCGGPCAKVCSLEVSPILVKWARTFNVEDGIYSAVAFISNPNVKLFSNDVPYSFKLYDKNNLLVREIRGFADILPGSDFPVFDGGINTGSLMPVKATFEFTGIPEWQRGELQTDIDVRNIQIKNNQDGAKVTATVYNNGVIDRSKIPLTAIIYDTNNNAVAASETLIDRISISGSTDIVFTWPTFIKGGIGSVKVYPKISN